MTPFNLKIITPDEVNEFRPIKMTVYTELGEMGILARHENYVVMLRPNSAVKVYETEGDNQYKYVGVTNGFLKIAKESTTIIATSIISERRRVFRISTDNLHGEMIDENGMKRLVVTKDMSENGVKLEITDAGLKEKDEIIIDIDINGAVFKVPCVVRNVRGKVYGCEFTFHVGNEEDAKTKDAILRYVKSR
jgi:hypothetical protein